MNLFVWGDLKDRTQISFILRRNYKTPLEPATLSGWVPGDYRPQFLFQRNETNQIEAAIASDLSTRDFIHLDTYHAVGDGIHSRIIRMVEVVRNGKKERVQAHVYVAGPSFSKLDRR